MVTAAFRRIPAVTGIIVLASIAVYAAQAWPRTRREPTTAGALLHRRAGALPRLDRYRADVAHSCSRGRWELAVRTLAAQRQRLVAEALTAENGNANSSPRTRGSPTNLLAARHALTAAPQPIRRAPRRRHTRPSPRPSPSCAAPSSTPPYLLEQAGSPPRSPGRPRRSRASRLRARARARRGAAGVHDRAPALCEQAPRQCRPPRARNASPRHADPR